MILKSLKPNIIFYPPNVRSVSCITASYSSKHRYHLSSAPVPWPSPDLRVWFQHIGIQSIFAYTVRFDRYHLPELRYYILRLEFYRQHNSQCRHSDDRLKCSCGVVLILQLLSRNRTCHKNHNAFFRYEEQVGNCILIATPFKRSYITVSTLPYYLLLHSIGLF